MAYRSLKQRRRNNRRGRRGALPEDYQSEERRSLIFSLDRQAELEASRGLADKKTIEVLKLAEQTIVDLAASLDWHEREVNRLRKRQAETQQLPVDWISMLRRFAEATPEIAELWLHGSRVRGEARPDSDLDIALRLDTVPEELGMLIEQKAAWRDELRERLPVSFDFDVMNPGNLRPEIVTQIEARGIRIFCRPQPARV